MTPANVAFYVPKTYNFASKQDHKWDHVELMV